MKKVQSNTLYWTQDGSMEKILFLKIFFTRSEYFFCIKVVLKEAHPIKCVTPYVGCLCT